MLHFAILVMLLPLLECYPYYLPRISVLRNHISLHFRSTSFSEKLNEYLLNMGLLKYNTVHIVWFLCWIRNNHISTNLTLKAELKSSALCTIISLEQSPWVWIVQGITKSPGREAVGVLSKHSGTSRPGSKRSIVNVTLSSSEEQK